MLLLFVMCVKVGAAFQPNPGECFLEQRVDENGQTVQDYTKDMTYVRLFSHVY